MPKSLPAAHPIPSCHAVICQDDAVLLVQRARNPYGGYWGLPGGKVELGETVAQALMREVAEETGLTVVPQRLITYRDAIDRTAAGDVTYHFVMFYFVAAVQGGRLRSGDDAAAVRWVPIAQLASWPVVPDLLDIVSAATGLSVR